jgi:hypothetical protein
MIGTAAADHLILVGTLKFDLQNRKNMAQDRR